MNQTAFVRIFFYKIPMLHYFLSSTIKQRSPKTQGMYDYSMQFHAKCSTRCSLLGRWRRMDYLCLRLYAHVVVARATVVSVGWRFADSVTITG
jgi:hypothetical protein